MENVEPPWDREAMSRWSKLMFRNEHRLAVAVFAAHANNDELYPDFVARHLELHDAEVRKHFRAFTALGLLEPSPTPPQLSGKRGAPPKLSRRTEDEFWGCIQELGDRFRRPPRQKPS